MSLFSNYAVIALLQLLCIVVSFFTPELLYRASGREQRWHVPAASAFLIAAVLVLTWLYGTALLSDVAGTVTEVQVQEPAPKPEKATAPEAEEAAADFSVVTRFGTLPLPVGTAATLELSIANNGGQADFACELSVLDAKGAAPAPQDAMQVETLTAKTTAAPGETASCTWKVTPRIPGKYVLQPSAAARGATASQEVRVDVQHDYRVDVDDTVWVFNSRTQSSAEKMAQHLRDAGFHNAKAKGGWKTRSEEQYIFYRHEDKRYLDELFVEVGIPDVQPYYYDSSRVGNKVKELFEENPDMGFLVIIH